MKVIFCGINPGRVSAAAGAHFANPRNDRTTRGSGDLRRGDFAGAAARLERIAGELRPAWIAFVGKEAYRGAFGERPGLGLQERRLHGTRLFVLPSTSPANAAVPWRERERWFEELAGRASGLPLRRAVRALVVDPADRILLVRFSGGFWASPGGGVDADEGYADALRRELDEERRLGDYELGPCIWVREHWFAGLVGWGGQEERIHLVRTDAFEPEPRFDLRLENVEELRWWRADELLASDADFAPRRLPSLVHDLHAGGPPEEPLDVGV